MSICVRVLVENTAAGQGLLAEHGLACWIESPGQTLLFDTGQGLALQHNADQVGVPWQRLDSVILSHGHYDHTGGLEQVLERTTQVTVYAHPDWLLPRYIRTSTGAVREVGIPPHVREAVEQRAAAWIRTAQPTAIQPNFTVTGAVPRVTEFEDTGGAFYLDEPCQCLDPLHDDQALFFPSAGGTVVLLGCAHAGVINTLLYIRQLTGGLPIHTVMGGMHLVNASATRLERTIASLQELGVERLAPGHCTGSAATAALRTAFPGQCLDFCVGATLDFK
jgi:7,8-dihydropterin-6-yl-methyl-4-(beta-D-ribofuranosyl)aminobenzene 5'-phosphate synthase